MYVDCHEDELANGSGGKDIFLLARGISRLKNDPREESVPTECIMIDAFEKLVPRNGNGAMCRVEVGELPRLLLFPRIRFFPLKFSLLKDTSCSTAFHLSLSITFLLSLCLMRFFTVNTKVEGAEINIHFFFFFFSLVTFGALLLRLLIL